LITSDYHKIDEVKANKITFATKFVEGEEQWLEKD